MNEYFKPAYSRWFYSPKTFLDNIAQTFRWLKWLYQRATRGYAGCDCWNIDSYLIEIIPPMLKNLNENRHGYPMGMSDKKWESTINEMIEGFEIAKRIEDLDYQATDMETVVQQLRNDQKLYRKKMRLFVKYFFALWD